MPGDGVTLLSRNGRDRTALFCEPFRGLAGLSPLVLAVPDERGVTHIGALTKAMRQRIPTISAGHSD